MTNPQEGSAAAQEGDEQPTVIATPETPQGSQMDITGVLEEATQKVGEHATELTKTDAENAETIPLNEVVYFQIEDEKVLTMMTGATLRTLGLQEVDEAGKTLEDGLQKLEKVIRAGKKIHLLILDQQFPATPDTGAQENAEAFILGMNKFKENDELRLGIEGIKTVIFFSGTAQEKDLQQLKNLLPGVTVQLLGKPPPKNGLLKAIVTALRNSKTIAAAEADEVLARFPDELPDEL